MQHWLITTSGELAGVKRQAVVEPQQPPQATIAITPAMPVGIGTVGIGNVSTISATSSAGFSNNSNMSSEPKAKKPRLKLNGRELPNHIDDGSDTMAFSLEQANARIKRIKTSNRFETDAADIPRVSQWMVIRPGTRGSSLTVEQRADVVQFYEIFRPKYSAKWLIGQIEAKYGLSSLRAYFSRFMSQCYKVTNQVQKPQAVGNGGSTNGQSRASSGTGGGRGRKSGASNVGAAVAAAAAAATGTSGLDNGAVQYQYAFN